MQTHTYPFTFTTDSAPEAIRRSKNNSITGLRDEATITKTNKNSGKTTRTFPAWTIKRGQKSLDDNGLNTFFKDFERNGKAGTLTVNGQDYDAYTSYLGEKSSSQENFIDWLKTLGFTAAQLQWIKDTYHQDWSAPLATAVAEGLPEKLESEDISFPLYTNLHRLTPLSQKADVGIVSGQVQLTFTQSRLAVTNQELELSVLPGTLSCQGALSQDGMKITSITVSNPSLLQLLAQGSVKNDEERRALFRQAEEFEFINLLQLNSLEEVEKFLRKHYSVALATSMKSCSNFSPATFIKQIQNSVFKKMLNLEDNEALSDLAEFSEELNKNDKISFSKINKLIVKLLAVQDVMLNKMEESQRILNTPLEIANRIDKIIRSLESCQKILLKMKSQGKTFVGDGIQYDGNKIEGYRSRLSVFNQRKLARKQFMKQCEEFANSEVVNRIVSAISSKVVKQALIDLKKQVRMEDPKKSTLLILRNSLLTISVSDAVEDHENINIQLSEQKKNLENLIWGSADFINSKFELKLVTPLFDELKKTHPKQAQRRLDYYQGERRKPRALYAANEVRAFEEIIEAQKQFDKALTQWKADPLNLELLKNLKLKVIQLQMTQKQWIKKLPESAFRDELNSVSQKNQIQKCFEGFDAVVEKVNSDRQLLSKVKKQQQLLAEISPYQAGLSNANVAALSLGNNSYITENSDASARVWSLTGEQRQILIKKFPHSLAVDAFIQGRNQPHGLMGFDLKSKVDRLNLDTPHFWCERMFNDILLISSHSENYVKAKEQNLLDALAIKDLAALQKIYASDISPQRVSTETPKQFIQNSLLYQRIANMELADLRAGYKSDIRVRNLLALNPDLVFELAKANVNVAIVLFENKTALKNAGFSAEQKQTLVDKHQNNPDFYKTLSWFQRRRLTVPIINKDNLVAYLREGEFAKLQDWVNTSPGSESGQEIVEEDSSDSSFEEQLSDALNHAPPTLNSIGFAKVLEKADAEGFIQLIRAFKEKGTGGFFGFFQNKGAGIFQSIENEADLKQICQYVAGHAGYLINSKKHELEVFKNIANILARSAEARKLVAGYMQDTEDFPTNIEQLFKRYSSAQENVYMEVALKAAPKKPVEDPSLLDGYFVSDTLATTSSTARVNTALATTSPATTSSEPLSIEELLEDEESTIKEILGQLKNRWEEFFRNKGVKQAIVVSDDDNHEKIKALIVEYTTQHEEFNYLEFVKSYPLAVTFATENQIPALVANVSKVHANILADWITHMPVAHHSKVMNVDGVRKQLNSEDFEAKKLLAVFQKVNDPQLFFGADTNKAESLLIKLLEAATSLEQEAVDSLAENTGLQNYLRQNSAIQEKVQSTYRGSEATSPKWLEKLIGAASDIESVGGTVESATFEAPAPAPVSVLS